MMAGVAQELGRVIGGALGKRVERQEHSELSLEAIMERHGAQKETPCRS